SMIPIGQKNTLAEYMILSGADNRPPMLDKDLVTKDLWERIQLLMQDTSLTKQERECKLYDEFDKFVHIKGESLHQYYLRFTQLINDINIYKMKLKQFQVNTKFLNSLPPEWSKFMTDVKLVKDLHTTNFDQLHAYLQQHELHANEVRIMGERIHDPLALVVDHQQTLSHLNTYQSSYNNPKFQQQLSPSLSPQYGSIHPTQHYSSTHPSTPLAISYLSTPYSNAYTSSVYQDAYPQPQFVPQIEYIVSTVNQQTHLAEFPQINFGLTVPVFKQGDDPIDAINKMMSFLSIVLRGDKDHLLLVLLEQGLTSQKPSGNNSGQQRVVKYFNCQGEVLNEEELEFLADLRVAEGPVTQTVITHNASYQEDDLNAYNSGCDDFSTAKAVLMANLSSYGSDVLSEDINSSAQQDAMILSVFEQLSNQVTDCNKVSKDNLMANESLSGELERYKEREKNVQFADFEKNLTILNKLCRIPLTLHFIQSITKSELEMRKRELF
ncbi:hypothetical protein Tco_1257753, partial [Tanacetum coccineum]